MTNKITFCSDPDIMNGEAAGLKNYNNNIIKEILNTCDHDKIFYLIDNHSSKEWLIKVNKQVNIIIDCNDQSVNLIESVCQKK